VLFNVLLMLAFRPKALAAAVVQGEVHNQQPTTNSRKGGAEPATNNRKSGAQPATKKVSGIQFLT
jgi:hypothetical protein